MSFDYLIFPSPCVAAQSETAGVKAGLLGRWQGCRGGAEPRCVLLQAGVEDGGGGMVELVYLTTTLQPAKLGLDTCQGDLPCFPPSVCVSFMWTRLCVSCGDEREPSR